VDLELESHFDRSVSRPLWLGQPARVFCRSRNHFSGWKPCESLHPRGGSFSFAFRMLTLVKEGDEGQDHRVSRSPRWASGWMVLDQLNYAREYFYSAIPANHPPAGQDAHCAREESQ
jgi:hypothetical protein